MNRRRFLGTSGLGVIGLSFAGCATTQEGGDGAPDLDDARHSVGEQHLVFDHDSVEFEIDPYGHRIHSLDDSGRRDGVIGSLGDGAGELNFPVAAAVARDGRLYVLDRGNSRVQIFSPSGEHVATFGGHGSGASQLDNPSDLALDEAGNVYVADLTNHRVQVFDASGRHVRSIGRFGHDAGELNGPRGLTVAGDELHVVDYGNARVQVYRLDGTPSFSYGGFGEDRGEFLAPSSIVSDRRGRLLVSDPVAGRVSMFDSNGRFIRRFRPKDSRGRRVVPARLALTHDRQLRVWTAGHATAE